MDWSDEAFLQDFEACSFPAALFDHEAHLRLAWLYLQQVTIDAASSFEEYLLEYPRVKTAFKELINNHYQEDIFHCPTAKAHYLAPDWQPFR